MVALRDQQVRYATRCHTDPTSLTSPFCHANAFTNVSRTPPFLVCSRLAVSRAGKKTLLKTPGESGTTRRRMTMKTRFSYKARVSAVLAIAFITVLAGTAWALSNVTLKLGTVASYDFGGFGPRYPVPGTVQIPAFAMTPGDSVPWHYHKGTSYVILAHGSLTEEHLVGPDECVSEEVPAGSAFVESPGQVHLVTNTGHDVAVIWWATIFPESDGIV